MNEPTKLLKNAIRIYSLHYIEENGSAFEYEIRKSIEPHLDEWISEGVENNIESNLIERRNSLLIMT